MDTSKCLVTFQVHHFVSEKVLIEKFVPNGTTAWKSVLTVKVKYSGRWEPTSVLSLFCLQKAKNTYVHKNVVITRVLGVFLIYI